MSYLTGERNVNVLVVGEEECCLNYFQATWIKTNIISPRSQNESRAKLGSGSRIPDTHVCSPLHPEKYLRGSGQRSLGWVVPLASPCRNLNLKIWRILHLSCYQQSGELLSQTPVECGTAVILQILSCCVSNDQCSLLFR